MGGGQSRARGHRRDRQGHRFSASHRALDRGGADGQRLLVEIGATAAGRWAIAWCNWPPQLEPPGGRARRPRALRDETGETVHLAVPSGLCMVYIEKLESPSAVQMASRIGMCLHSTAVGKAYLAALAPDAAEPLLGQIG